MNRFERLAGKRSEARTHEDLRGSRAGKPGSRFARFKKFHQHRDSLIHQEFKTIVHQGDYMQPNSAHNLSVVDNASQQVEDSAIDLRERLRAISEDDRSYPQSRIAKEAGISSTSMSQFLGGTYPADPAKIEAKLRAWLEAYEDRLANGGLPEGPAWVTTPTAEKIINGLRYAQLANDIVLIYGGAGLGKSKSIERYRQSMPNVFTVEMAPATAGVLACLEEIALAIGLRDFLRSAAFLQRAICNRLRGTNGLLIIDEAQHLGVQALDQVRAIHDKTKVGLALVGNERVYTQMAGSNRAAYLDRLYSRVGKRIHLKRATDADADCYVKAWGIEDAGCRARVREIAAKPGALRVLNKVLRLAATYAQAAKREMCCEDIHAAWRELGGLD